MPNWCSNEISIIGSKEKIAEIKTIIEAIEPSECRVFRELIGTAPDFKEEDWYSHNVNFYGTKWDVSPSDCNMSASEEEIILTPDTAWAPPVGFCEKLAKKFNVTVTDTYYEPGMDFSGVLEVSPDGEVSNDEKTYYEGKYEYDNEGFWDDMENYYMNEDTLDGQSIDEYIESNFDFLDDEDRGELNEIFTRLYNESKSEDQD